MTFEILCETCNTLAELLSYRTGHYRALWLSETLYQVMIGLFIVAIPVVALSFWKKEIGDIFSHVSVVTRRAINGILSAFRGGSNK